MPVMRQEFLEEYERLSAGAPAGEMRVDRFEDYIRHIGEKDKETEDAYWENYLDGLTDPTLLPFVEAGERNKGIGEYREEVLLVDKAGTSRIDAYAQQNRITVNTVMQGVWSYLLHRYTNN